MPSGLNHRKPPYRHGAGAFYLIGRFNEDRNMNPFGMKFVSNVGEPRDFYITG